MKLSELRKTIFEEYYKILSEGRVDDLRKAYVDKGKISAEDFNELVDVDPTPAKKYLQWIVKNWIVADTKDRGMFKQYIASYDNLVSKNKIKQKDVNGYKTFNDLKNDIDILNISGQTKSKSQLSKDAITILDNEDLLIKQPKNHVASRNLGLTDFAFRDCENGGKDSAWCTTYKTPEHWDNYYNTNNVTFYYVKVRSEKMLKQISEIPQLSKKWKAYVVLAFAIIPNPRRSAKNKTPYLIDAYDGKDKQVPKKILDELVNILGIKQYLVPDINQEERNESRMRGAYNQLEAAAKQVEKSGTKDLDPLVFNNLPQQLTIPSKLNKVKTITLSKTAVVFPETFEATNDFGLSDTEQVVLPTKMLKVGLWANFTKLPIDNLSTLKASSNTNLRIINCNNLKELPQLPKVADIVIMDCPSLRLAHPLESKEEVKLKRYMGTTLPAIKATEVELECPNLQIIDQPIVAKKLKLASCPKLEKITEQVKVQEITIERFAKLDNLNLTSIPANIALGGDLDALPNIDQILRNRTLGFDEYDVRVDTPTKLKKLPEGVKIPNGTVVQLDYNSQLRELPANLTLLSLRAEEGSKLQAIPDNLTVQSMNLKNNIRVIPSSVTFDVVKPANGDGPLVSTPLLMVYSTSKLEKIEQVKGNFRLHIIIDNGKGAPIISNLLQYNEKTQAAYAGLVNVLKKYEENEIGYGELLDSKEFIKAQTLIFELLKKQGVPVTEVELTAW